MATVTGYTAERIDQLIAGVSGGPGGDTTVQIGTVTLPVFPTEGLSVSVLADSTTVLPEGVTWDSGGEPTITERMLLVFVWSGDDWVGTYGPSIPDVAATTTTTTTTTGGTTTTTTTGGTTTTTTTTADTTPPTAGTLAASAIKSSGFTLTVTGASDDVALHGTPYRFSTDDGATYSAWQAGATFNATGLDAETEYDCIHQVRDAALNVATGSSIPVTTGAAPSGDTFFTDFSEYTTGVAPSDWTQQWVTTTDTIHDDNGTSVLRSTNAGSAIRGALAWDDVPTATDAEVLAKFRTDSAGISHIARFRVSGSTASETGYSIIASATFFYWGKYEAGAYTTIAPQSSFTRSQDTWYWVRARVSGTSLQARIWADGDTEPGTWLVDQTDSTVTGTGHVAVGTGSSGATVDHGYFSVGLNGEPAS